MVRIKPLRGRRTVIHLVDSVALVPERTGTAFRFKIKLPERCSGLPAMLPTLQDNILRYATCFVLF